ncbi:MAG: mechanosensitive ion channel family protein [Sulfurimonas sp.]|uniref:mechanosensitive ion channel family protein n=1 Tax=Sulfurimonas sp. TaxID=2022749 RepID=UPI0025CB77E7|nr:mechanosensitive ion channel family protein [Sulfurimonas sp.]MCK9492303.1 mechanosensitive ion channel family protein [Sulfurimonas sp.]
MNESNTTQEKIMLIAQEQKNLYSKKLDEFLTDKEEFINSYKNFNAEIFALEKVIKLNKRLGNNYAVVRDEVLVKSYKLLDAQSDMIKSILRALDDMEFVEYQTYMSEMFAKNQEYNAELTSVDYFDILALNQDSAILKQAQQNIKDYYALIEINADVLKYLSMFEKKMYRLNKYSKFNLINPVISINNTSIAQKVNSIIEPYGFSVVKILFMIVVSILMYILRTYIYIKIESFIVEIHSLKKYSQDILKSIRKPMEIVMILLGIEVLIFIYYDFSGVGILNELFKISYAILLTFMIYKVVNNIAFIKIHEIQAVDKKIKREVINVGIKIINFIIMVIGLLIVLYLAGADLTAILSGLGIGGLAVALASKDSLANFFGTLSILFSDVFSQGDWIVVNGLEGTVVEIGLRVTTLRTFDNAIIAIPNSILTNKEVKNWNKRSLGRRIKMSVGVKYDSKSEDLKNAVAQIRKMLEEHPQIATVNTEFNYESTRSSKLVSREDEIGIKKTLLVYLDEFAPSSINILVYCFSKSVVWDEWLEVKEDVLFKIMQILEQNSLEFAFPSMSLYHESNQPS